ncbi:DNA polymerase [Maritalea sp. P4.10X]|uniref:DNA polymerase I n=1 Tax=Maritalea mediterranea TaxID=2909667 RepID=A0ABS9EC79_9HYPH|nr:DNA polymerase [Maritalea mediterranea]
MVAEDVDTGQFWSASSDNGQVLEVIGDVLEKADQLIGHNIIKFDIPAIQKVYPWFKFDEGKVSDTLILSRLIWPNVATTDMDKIRKGHLKMPPKLAGSHSLEAWGHRLDDHKIQYEGGFEEWSPDMQYYCEQDVHLNVKLFKFIEERGYHPDAVALEHALAFIIAQQERNGIGFNVDKAEALYRQLAQDRAKMEDELREVFPPWEVVDKVFTPKANNKRLGYVKGVPVTKYKTKVFNPNSRHHIADRLKAIYGWKPKDFTPKGQPKVDEKILDKLPYPEAKKIARYMMLQKRIGQLAEGDNAWLKLVQQGRIFHSVDTVGAVTRRATHSRPNIAQVPSAKSEYGPECRELFEASHGRVMVGCDVSGLELRMLAHYMKDDDYTKVLLEGDIHTVNQEAAGLPTRDAAKTFIYALLYGAGDQKIGEIIGKGRKAGSEIKKRFLKNLPKLGKLIDGVSKKAQSTGTLKAIDGGQLHVRSAHAALNTLLQSAGAIVCKKWIVEFWRLLRERDLDSKVTQVAWVHDELQMEVDEEYAEIVGNTCVEAIVVAGEKLGVRVPLTGEFAIGASWKDTH